MSYCSRIGLDLESAVETITDNVTEEVQEEEEEFSISSIIERCATNFLDGYLADEDREIDDELYSNILEELQGQIDGEEIMENIEDAREYRRDPLGYHGMSEKDFL